MIPNQSNEVLTRDILCQTHKCVIDTFGKICGSEISAREGAGEISDLNKIVGIMSFVGDPMLTLTLVLPNDSAEMIAEKFAGFKIMFDCADMGDVVGELINVLGGVLSGNLESVGYSTDISLPIVARGDAFEMVLPDNLVSKRFCFVAMDLDFWVEVTGGRPK